MKTARQWKSFYAAERAWLGEAGLHALLDRAPDVALPSCGRGALIFPHTRLETSGELPAAAALAVLRSGAEAVLALGVLHGAREADAALVQRARDDGEPEALRTLRRVHGPGIPSDAGHWREEFSLDNFCTLLELAARRAGRRPPRVILRYPFLVGPTPADLPGFEELIALLTRENVALVATTDPVHHGVGYHTPPAACLPREAATTHDYARRAIESGFRQLVAGDYAAFLRDAAANRSDFRDTGPVLAELLRRFSISISTTIHSLHLVNYADALKAPTPTWVAATLATFAAAGETEQRG